MTDLKRHAPTTSTALIIPPEDPLEDCVERFLEALKAVEAYKPEQLEQSGHHRALARAYNHLGQILTRMEFSNGWRA